MIKRKVICITIQEIDAEIKRLKALKDQKEKEALPEHKEYISKLYKHTDGSIGKIIDVYFKDGKVRFKGQNLWFDDEDYSIINEEDIFDFCDFDVITPEKFRSVYNDWTKQIILSYGIKESE